MKKNNIVDSLKDFGLTDEEILKIADLKTLEAISQLKASIFKKWNMDTITAFNTVKALKSYFNIPIEFESSDKI